jgi:hypothetical protein
MSHWAPYYNPLGQWTPAWAKQQKITRELGRTRPLVSFPLLKKIYDKHGFSWVTLRIIEGLDDHLWDRMHTLERHCLLQLSEWKKDICPVPTRGQKLANWWRITPLGLITLVKFYQIKEEHYYIVSKYWLDPEGESNETIDLAK